jgi:nicotinamidase/pyrazinamidase
VKKALIIVDVQNDFLPGGALAVPFGDEIIPNINRMVQLPFDQIVATQDWHPRRHVSFASTWGKKPGEHITHGSIDQILWPDHCVQGSRGAKFSRKLDTSHFHKIIHKGSDANIDSYSTFFDNLGLRSTGLEGYLREKECEELYFAGLATDYCVLYSVRDALTLGLQSFVVTDACRGIDSEPGDVERALEEMRERGAILLSTLDVENKFSLGSLVP